MDKLSFPSHYSAPSSSACSRSRLFSSSMYIALVLVCVTVAPSFTVLCTKPLRLNISVSGITSTATLLLSRYGADDGVFSYLMPSIRNCRHAGAGYGPCMFRYLDCTKERLSTISIDFADTMACHAVLG